MTDQSGESRPAVLRLGENITSAIEIVTGIIAAVSAVVAFVNDSGGLWRILMEIGLFGCATYIALIPAALLLSLLGVLEARTGRETKPVVAIWTAAAIALILALVVRFALFDPNLLDDVDTMGSVFMGLLGIVVILVPLVVLWWRKGSTPKT